MNLHEKLIEIRKSVEYAKKDNRGYNYDYVSGTSLLGVIRPKMDELGVILSPSAQNRSWTETTKANKKGELKPWFIVDCDMAMTWINAENPKEREAVPFLAFGAQDDISKAFGSALTYSERYFMLKYFNVPTDKLDPDAFQEKYGPASPPIETASLEQLKEIKNTAEISGWTVDDMKVHCQDTYAVKSSTELSPDQAQNVTDYIKNNPKAQEKDAEGQETAPEGNGKARYPWMDKNETGFSTMVWKIQNSGELAKMEKEDPNQYEAMKDKWGRICKESDWPPEQDF